MTDLDAQIRANLNTVRAARGLPLAHGPSANQPSAAALLRAHEIKREKAIMANLAEHPYFAAPARRPGVGARHRTTRTRRALARLALARLALATAITLGTLALIALTAFSTPRPGRPDTTTPVRPSLTPSEPGETTP